MDPSLKYTILAGASMSILSSLFVIIEISFIKYKDLANILILILVSTDFTISLTTLAYIYPQNLLICSISIYFALFIRNIHKLMIFFLSYSMYSIIVKSQYVSSVFILVYAFCGLLFSIAYFLVFLELSQPNLFDNYCSLVTTEQKSTMLIINSIIEIIPDFLILLCVIHMYWKVRKTLRLEAIKSSIIGAKRRIFAKRLIGFVLAFGFFFFPYSILSFLFYFNVSDTNLILTIDLVFYGWYPFVDSVIYGFTKSFKRNICNFCFKNPEFDEYEKTLYILRKQNIIRPRFYLDLIEQSESFEIWNK